MRWKWRVGETSGRMELKQTTTQSQLTPQTKPFRTPFPLFPGSIREALGPCWLEWQLHQPRGRPLTTGLTAPRGELQRFTGCDGKASKPRRVRRPAGSGDRGKPSHGIQGDGTRMDQWMVWEHSVCQLSPAGRQGVLQRGSWELDTFFVLFF